LRKGPNTLFEKVRGVSDVGIEVECAHLVVDLPPDQRTPARHLRIYKEFGAAAIPLQMIKMHPGGISFAVERERLADVREILTRMGYRYQYTDEMVIISVISVNMREMYGVMAKIAETLLEADTEIAQLGDSHDSVLCIVPKRNAQEAIKRLRKTFNLRGASHGKEARP